MWKKAAIAMLLLAMLSGSANAAVYVSEVSPGLDVNFLRATETVVFKVYDDNTECHAEGNCEKITYQMDIDRMSTRGGTRTNITADVNLGTGDQKSTACDSNIGNVTVTCHYSLDTTAITDGNYFLDVNVHAHFTETPLGTGINDYNRIADANMDSNVSFYIDNTTPTCKIETKRDNDFEWVVLNETAAVAAGSKTTLYYSIVNPGRDPSYSNTVTNLLADKIDDGKHDYACYAADSAGNTSSAEEATMQWPPEGGVTVVSRGSGGTVGQAAVQVQSVVGDIAADPMGFATANPLFVVIALGAVYLLFFNKSKRKKGKRR